MFNKYSIKNYNFKLVLLVLLITGFGTVIIYSADHTYLKKQLMGLVLCVTAMFVVSVIDYKWVAKYWPLLYAGNLIMLIALRFIGKNVNGATRWFAIGSFATVQPSEFSKILLIICASVFLTKYKEKLNTPKVLLTFAGFCAVPLFLIYKQPDLSTTIDITLILFCVLFTAGLSYKLIGIFTLIMIPIVGSFLWYIQRPDQKLLDDYQLGRVLAFIYPQDYLQTTGYQQNNSVMAIGSGMLKGKGLNTSSLATVKESNLVSEQQTDFIFSVVGEELGFIGCIFLIAIIILIVLQCIKIARKADDTTGMLIATGVASVIAIQTFINIGVATAVLPNTGLPLPFISYGLSSLLSSCIGIGLVLNVGLQKRKY